MGLAAGWPANGRAGGRGAIGAPGVSPGADGRGAGRGGIGEPGTLEGALGTEPCADELAPDGPGATR